MFTKDSLDRALARFPDTRGLSVSARLNALSDSRFRRPVWAQDAKDAATALCQAAANDGVRVARGRALCVISEMAGYRSWNAARAALPDEPWWFRMARGGLLICGAPGTGKTVLAEAMAAQAAKLGARVSVIDPFQAFRLPPGKAAFTPSPRGREHMRSPEGRSAMVSAVERPMSAGALVIIDEVHDYDIILHAQEIASSRGAALISLVQWPEAETLSNVIVMAQDASITERWPAFQPQGAMPAIGPRLKRIAQLPLWHFAAFYQDGDEVVDGVVLDGNIVLKDALTRYANTTRRP